MNERSTRPDRSDDIALRALSAQYAAAVDHIDRAAFCEAFLPDGVLEVHLPGSPGPSSRMQGHDDLAHVTENIIKYAKTYHFVGQATFEVDGDEATGEVYCTAHHLTRDGAGDTDKVMYIRYADQYRRSDSGWRFAVRAVHVDWSDIQAVKTP